MAGASLIRSPEQASNIEHALGRLSSRGAEGRQFTSADRLQQVRDLAEAGGLHTMEPLLPICLRLNQEPYTLTDHFHFSPMYNTAMPKRMLFKTARQVSKSTNQAAQGVMTAGCIPNFKRLYITPRYEQVRKFSNNYVRPFINGSPIKDLWTDTTTENSVLQRSFKNNAMMLFSFALLDVDRLRGISTDAISLDEAQDFDPAHLPIATEAMSHSKWELLTITGTPKSLDNPMEGYWRSSSQAEWFIKCQTPACGEWNIPSLDYHIDAMLGPLHDFISEKYPGLVCHKCRKPISPRHGRWVHRRPDLRFKYAGYHISQPIMPLHYASHDKWAELLAKREGWGNTSINVFYNESLGESVDAGQKLVSETQLREACVLPWRNDPRGNVSEEVIRRLPHYKTKVLGVDWGGGGEEGVSFTTVALLGQAPDNKIDCLWGKRFVLSQEHLKEAIELIYWTRKFDVDMVIHDYTGAGVVRETVLVQAGFDLQKVMPIAYVRAAAKSLIKYVPASLLHNRAHYRLDKTRSLLYTFQAIKLGLLRFFQYDNVSDKDRGLLYDFMSLVEEKKDGRLAGDIYTITRNPLLPDDFAQSVNLGCAGIWHATNSWPNFAQAAAVARITASQVAMLGNRDYGWQEDPSMRSFFHQP